MYGISLRKNAPARWLTVTAMLMALNIAMSSFGVPVPGGHLYLNDAVICTAALLLDPLGAFMVGGIGAFLGDFFFYPLPMFVSLAVHGLQAAAISLLVHRKDGAERMGAVVPALLLGVAINVAGYSLGRALVYATPHAAMLKLPFQIFQASFGAAAAYLLCFKAGLLSFWERYTA